MYGDLVENRQFVRYPLQSHDAVSLFAFIKIPECDGRTDGRTDGHKIDICALAIPALA